MEDKKLIQEVKRIQEMMGLITEGSRTKIAKGAIDIIDNLLGITAKNTDVLAREYGDDGARLLKQLADNSDSARGVGDILDDLRKLDNPKAFQDALEGLKSAFDNIVDDSGVSITEKIQTVRKGVQDYLDNGQNTKAAEYYNSQVGNIADFGDETLERFVRDEYFFNSIPNFTRQNLDSWTKLGSEKIAKKGSVAAKVGKFMDTLTSYFKFVKNIESKIKSDLDSFVKLKDEVNKLPIDDPTRGEMIKRANRYLDRVEFNLGVIARKDRETLDVLIEELTTRRNALPKTSPERIKLNELIQRASKEDAEVISIVNYLPEGGYNPEVGIYEEMKQLKRDRVDALKKVFMPKKWASPEVAARLAKLNWWSSLWKVLSGNLGPVLKKIFSKDIKKLPRIAATEIGSRIISIPMYLGLGETIMDWVAYMALQDSYFTSEEFVREHPRMAKAIAGFGFDYKDYEGSGWGTDFVINLTGNISEKLGLTVPVYEAKRWLDENAKPGGGYEWWNQQFAKIDELQKSDTFKNASEEEKIEMLQDVVEETESWITKAAAWWYNGIPETLNAEINTMLSQIENEEPTPTPTPTSNTSNNDDSSGSSGTSGSSNGSSEITNTLDGLATQMGYPKDAMSPQTYNGTGEIEIWGMKFAYNSTDKKFEQK